MIRRLQPGQETYGLRLVDDTSCYNEGIIDSDTDFRELLKRVLCMPGKVPPVHSKPGKLVIIRHVNNILNLGGLK